MANGIARMMINHGSNIFGLNIGGKIYAVNQRFSRVSIEMRIVSTADLARNLTELLKSVQDGEELLITDHKGPVARLVPFVSEIDQGAEESELFAAGLVRPPYAKLLDSFWTSPAPEIATAVVLAAIESERDAD